MVAARTEAGDLPTIYQKKAPPKRALAACRAEAERDFTHVSELETFVQFQLMTAAQRGKTLNLTCANVDLDTQTALLNGRSSTLPLPAELIAMLKALPRQGDYVFNLIVDDLENT